MSGRGSSVSERDLSTTNEKPSETMFQRVLLDFVLKTFGLGAENEPRARIRGHFSRTIFTVIHENYALGIIHNISEGYENKKEVRSEFLTSKKTLCGQRDSNPHASRHQILSLTWLPITPCPQDLASESLPLAFICGAKIYTFYNICNFIYDFLENFSYFCLLNVSYCVLQGA